MSEPNATRTPAESLGMHTAALRRWWPLAVALIAVAAFAGYVVARQLPKTYDATARVLLDREREVHTLLGKSEYVPDPERDLNTGVKLITLEPVAGGVRRSLGLREPVDTLVGRVTTAVDSSSSVVSITARDSSAARAASIANAFAAGYKQYSARTARAAVGDAVAAARERLVGLPPGQQRDELGAELRRLEVAGAFQTGGVQVVDRATAASASSRPRPAVAAVIGGLLGAIVAALAIVVLARVDRRVRGDGELEQLSGQPVLAHLPRSERGAADALATLAISLWHPTSGIPAPGLVLLTSPGPEEGTAEVALGLAQALGAIGRSAIAIEADLRGPAFARQLALGRRAGLAGVLDGESDLERELVPLGDGATALPGGAPVGVPQALLAGPAMAKLVDDACGRADVVLLTASPVGVFGDALALAGLAEAVLLVARVDTTRVGELEQALRSLARAGTRTVGIVATTRAPGGGLLAARRAVAARRAGSAVTQPGGAPASASEVTVG
jgi:Mrp family chromosome partitioning ATPase